MAYRSFTKPCSTYDFNSVVRCVLSDRDLTSDSDDSFCTHVVKVYRCFRGHRLPLKRDLLRIHGERGHDDPRSIVGFDTIALLDNGSYEDLIRAFEECVYAYCSYCSDGNS